MSLKEISGVWQRRWEEDPLGDDGNADRTTLVFWIQTPCGIYIDLRLPKKSLDLPKADLDPSALAGKGIACTSEVHYLDIFSSQKSFAGVLDFELTDPASCETLKTDAVLASLVHNGPIPLSTCTWHRKIDYQPPTGSLDIGVCCASGPMGADGSVDMRETGHDATYAEGWHRLPETSKGPFMALELVSDERTGYWVRAGSHFAYAVGRPKSIESSFKDAMNASQKSLTEKADILGSYVCVVGRIEKDSGAWIINHSTHPELVGCELAGKVDGVNVCSLLEWNGDELLVEAVRGAGSVERRWKVVELDGCGAPVKNRAR